MFLLEAGQHLVSEMTCAVTVPQGTENWLVIYTDGTCSNHIGQVGETALIDNARDIFVIFTSERQHIRSIYSQHRFHSQQLSKLQQYYLGTWRTKIVVGLTVIPYSY